jgi:hypothetical protein
MSKQWFKLIDHAPGVGQRHLVRHGVNGTPFQAWQSEDYRWFKTLDDQDGDGTRELGERVGITLDLQWRGVLVNGIPVSSPHSDSDFDRLLEGTCKLNNLPTLPAPVLEPMKHRFSVHLSAGKEPSEFDFEGALKQLPDGLRQMMGKWNELFPERA